MAPSHSFSCSPRMFELLLPVGLGMWFDRTLLWESCYGLAPRAPTQSTAGSVGTATPRGCTLLTVPTYCSRCGPGHVSR